MLKLAIVLILPAIVVMSVFKNYWMNIFESNTNGMSDKFQDKNDLIDIQNEIASVIDENWKLNKAEAEVLLQYYSIMQISIDFKRDEYLTGRKTRIAKECICYMKLSNLSEYYNNQINLLKAKLGSR
ncbi:hypothetical protein [Thomasclavelia ramosa]|uniref:hypothetical protein n=1 Tax=Thomasclavelia ramosa TaxID=1547 RepID=UPI0034A5331B